LSPNLQGTSRGGANIQEIVHRLELWGVNHLYVIGGNGGNAVSHAGRLGQTSYETVLRWT